MFVQDMEGMETSSAFIRIEIYISHPESYCRQDLTVSPLLTYGYVYIVVQIYELALCAADYNPTLPCLVCKFSQN